MTSSQQGKRKTGKAIGQIVKALSGYYYVRPDNAASLAEVLQCRGRGIFKKKGQTPLVGDRVYYSVTENGEGMVDELLPRISELIRPPVANIEQAVLVFSVTEPALNLQLLDKFIVHIEHAGIEPLLCLSKEDLAAEDNNNEERASAAPQAKALEAMQLVQRIYAPLGYEIYMTSARDSKGLEALRARLSGKVSVFAGQSGVGKSSLLNALVPGLQLETNAISNRLGRGKHTTRHVELIAIGEEGFVADTPGFSQLDFQTLGIEDLGSCYREFRALAASCKFRGCTHQHEPGCAVREALAAGELAQSRYDSYSLFMTEMKEMKRRY